ncbi:MAG: biopolymer transporter ExbD [Candidatus Contendobacter sp.]
MNLRPQRRDDPELNLVPMIDVVLVLLIFFMLATSLRQQAELDIRLPSASGPPLPSAVAQLQVAIDAAGRYAINGQTLTATDAATLKDTLRMAAAGGSLPLTISADGRTPHQAVVTVLDVAAQLGLRQVAIATVNTADIAPPVTPAAPP